MGNFYKPRFVNNQILLFPKDKLVLYTDGLVEARNSKNEEYSLPRLKKVIQEQYKWGVEHLTEAITKDVQEFIGQNHQMTLLCSFWMYCPRSELTAILLKNPSNPVYKDLKDF